MQELCFLQMDLQVRSFWPCWQNSCLCSLPLRFAKCKMGWNLCRSVSEKKKDVYLLHLVPLLGPDLFYSFFFTICKSSSWLPSQLDRCLVLSFNIKSETYIFFFLVVRNSVSKFLGTERKQYSPPTGGRLCKYISVWGEGMRDDKIFRKHSDPEGCYSAQPGSRLMTLFARKGGQSHKICISGAGDGMGGGAWSWPCGSWPQNLLPTTGLLHQSSQQTAAGLWRVNAPMRDVLALPPRCKGLYKVLGKSTGLRVRKPGPPSNLLCEPKGTLGYLTSLSLCFFRLWNGDRWFMTGLG